MDHSGYLEYPLDDGFVANWLVAGPLSLSSGGEEVMLRFLSAGEAGGSEMPAEQAHVQVGEMDLTWRYYRCLEDHLVDLSRLRGKDEPSAVWAYTCIHAPAAGNVQLHLGASCPVALWLNGEHAYRGEQPMLQPGTGAFAVSLREGDNDLLMYLRASEDAASPWAFAVRLEAGDPRSLDLTVRLLTTARRPERRAVCERVFEHAYLDTPVTVKGNVIRLRWGDELDLKWRAAYQVQDDRGRIYLDGTTEAAAGTSVNVGHPARLWERQYYVVVRALPREYFEENLRYERRLPVYVVNNPHSPAPYGTYAERRREALEAALRHEEDPFAGLAGLALGQSKVLQDDLVSATIEAINGHEQEGALALLAILGAIYRFGLDCIPENLRDEVIKGALGFPYRPEEPGGLPDSEGIIVRACEILTGQLYPDVPFVSTGQTGAWHRDQGVGWVLSWLKACGAWGFPAWDSSDRYAGYIAALSHLTDLAEDKDVRELAAVIMDKMLFGMAVNSYQGILGSAQRCTDTQAVIGPRLEATSGVSRLLWGMGSWNQHLAGVVSLASSNYELPEIISAIALDTSGEVWNRERHGAGGEIISEAEVNKVTFKTPHYMLCSAQDYRPGQGGNREHIWQATMGPDALVFTNHPACATEAEAWCPNFWRGNRVLPRVAQWKDVLVALYSLPEDDWMGFTHAYFPIRAFDEYDLRGSWAFARYGKAYLALTAHPAPVLIKRGPGAYRELRSYGRHGIWLCHMGSHPADGTFAEFERRIQAMDLNVGELAVSCTTLRGDRLSFAWQGPLVLNGEEQPLGGFKHYDSQYCQAELPLSEMHITLGDYAMILDLA